MPVELADIRGIRDIHQATAFFCDLGYGAAPNKLDLREFEIGPFDDHVYLRMGRRHREGYGVLIAQAPQTPTKLADYGRKLRSLHDRPLSIIGVPGVNGSWSHFTVVRPRVTLVSSRPTYRVTRFEVDVQSPTHHDSEILEKLRWSNEENAQDAVDEAFDVEAVTRRFFTGLRAHFTQFEASLIERAARDSALENGLTEAGGARRVAIRLISQVLFCWFLQRKGLLNSDRQYLITLWRYSRKANLKYSDLLEELFYFILSVPVNKRSRVHQQGVIPFLNGGLFQRAYGAISLNFPDTLFDLDSGLLGFLSRWTFTINEESPDEVDVAVDPELLGRVFEHLITDDEQSAHGVVYTPRPVVQFMCREALISTFANKVHELSHDEARLLLTDDNVFDVVVELAGTKRAVKIAKAIDATVDALTILDPAVGSGAFLLGMMAELVRIKQLVYTCLSSETATSAQIHGWKLHIIERSLAGVDREPLALELCRLRLWLSLVVETDEQTAVRPLPNLDFRTIAADSLSDFFAGVEFQNIRRGSGAPLTLDLSNIAHVADLREAFFTASDASEKLQLLKQISDHELALITDMLRALAEQRGRHVADNVHSSMVSRDRVFPVFMPAFHFPEVVRDGGWDIVIMNPPYLGRRRLPERVEPMRLADYKLHYGDTNDLMILFGQRIADFVRPDGICAAIFQDSVLTSKDALAFRRTLTQNAAIEVIARTKCFEDQAISGAVVIWRQMTDKSIVAGRG